MAEKVSILDNGQKTHTFTYRVNGVKVYESLDLDTANGNFAKTVSIKIKEKGKFIDVSPNSELGQIIANGGDGGARQNEFLNAIDDISTKVGRQKSSNSDTLETALRESDMYEVSRGFVPLDKTVPAVEYIIEGEAINAESDLNSYGSFTDFSSYTGSSIFGTNYSDLLTLGYKQYAEPPADLKFPKDAYYDAKGGPSQDYVKLDMFSYKAPQEDMLAGTFNGTLKDGSTIPEKKGKNRNKWIKKRNEEQKGTFKDTLFKGLQTGRRTKEYKGTVRLPIPNQLGSSNAVAWGEGSANAFEMAAFMAGYTAIGGLLGGSDNFLSLIGKGAGEAQNIVESIKSQGGDAAQLVSAQATKMALQQLNINTDTRQFVTRATGKAVNPNLETLFSGPKIRSFSFQFAFMPQDENDSSELRKIMRFFKQGMLPARGSSDGAPGDLFLLSPNVFRISYMNGENRIKSLNTFKMCALTGCEINFTPGGFWSAYDDPDAISQPTSSTMTLSFSELTPIFADDYEATAANKERLQDLVDEQGPLSDWLTDKDIGF